MNWVEERKKKSPNIEISFLEYPLWGHTIKRSPQAKETDMFEKLMRTKK